MVNKTREPLYKRRRDLWREVIFDTRDEASEELAQKRLRLLERWSQNRWAFLTGRDVPEPGARCICADSAMRVPEGWQHVTLCPVQGRPIIWTVDERDDNRAVKPYPADKLYLREIDAELWAHKRVLIDKIRQKYVSTHTMLEALWFAAFREERDIFVSRVTEESAEKLINDKIRKVYEFMPKWLVNAIPITLEPKKLITFKESGSTIQGVAQNFASASGRGPTGSLIVVDEGAFQDEFHEIWRAVLPMAARFWAVSTANIGSAGAQKYRELIFEGRPRSIVGYRPAAEEGEDREGPEDEAADTIHYRPGLSAYTSPKGNRIIVLRLGADPDDTPEWIAEAKIPYTMKDWRREMEGDWSTPAGDPYFPIFGQIGREKYVHVATHLLKGAPVIISLDFGRRFPAATWAQYDAKQHRIWGLREFMPHDLQTHEFRDAVRFLSGLLRWEEVPERAQEWVRTYAAKQSGAHCPPPWFPLGTRFIAVGGKEANQSQANAKADDSVAADIFAAGGLPLVIVSPSVLGRNRIVDQMLMVSPEDGWPRTFLDPQMEEVIEGFEGAFSYPEPTKKVPWPTHPKDDGYYINLLDAWGYGVVAVAPEEKPQQRQPDRVIGYDGREPIMRRAPEVGEDEVGWAETRRRRR